MILNSHFSLPVVRTEEHSLTVLRFAVFLALLGCVLGPTQAAAVDLGQWVSGLKAQVYANERFEYETNVFLRSSRTEDDLIIRSALGFLVSYDKGPLTLGAGYRAEFLDFLTLNSQDNIHHFPVFTLAFSPERWKLGLRTGISATSDPPNTELTSRIDTTTITFAPDYEYKLTPRLALGVNYGYNRVLYDKRAEPLNKTEHVMGGSVFWKFVPKADVYVRYNYGFTDFVQTDRTGGDRLSDRDIDARHIFTVGLRGDVTPKLSSSFQVGYETREHESARFGEESTIVLGGETTYKPTERTRLALLSTRSFQDSIFGQRLLTISYVSTAFTLLGEQQLGTKVRANARLLHVTNEYPNKEVTGTEVRQRWRDDTILGWGGGIDYDIQKWLTVGAEYAHTRRDSNFSEFNYKDDKVTAKLTLQF